MNFSSAMALDSTYTLSRNLSTDSRQRTCFDKQNLFLPACHTGWAKKVIPLVQWNIMYERYHFFGPPCISRSIFDTTANIVDKVAIQL